MIEYHGWVNIWDTVFVDESDDSRRLAIAADVRSRLEELSNATRILELRWINGQCILCIAGSTNHRTQDVTEVIRLFEWIAKVAPGSYGLLYLLDDEDPQGKDDEFQIFKIAKGKMTIEKDRLLSPCQTEIFDGTV